MSEIDFWTSLTLVILLTRTLFSPWVAFPVKLNFSKIIFQLFSIFLLTSVFIVEHPWSLLQIHSHFFGRLKGPLLIKQLQKISTFFSLFSKHDVLHLYPLPVLIDQDLSVLLISEAKFEFYLFLNQFMGINWIFDNVTLCLATRGTGCIHSRRRIFWTNRSSSTILKHIYFYR